jgi:hypothetical protein
VNIAEEFRLGPSDVLHPSGATYQCSYQMTRNSAVDHVKAMESAGYGAR